MAEIKDYRSESKRSWGSTAGTLNLDQINTGALLRIADATEAMSKRHVELMNERDMYKRWYESTDRDRDHLKRQVAGLKGAITRMKRKNDGR